MFFTRKPLGKENARVSITHVIKGAVEIPFPINDDIRTVEEAVATFIAWPRNLLQEVKASSAPVKPITLKVLITPHLFFFISLVEYSVIFEKYI